MIKYLFGLLLVCTANAGTLDSVVQSTNNALLPKVVGERGFDVEYREENGYVWVNIQTVTFLCKDMNRVYASGSALNKQTIKVCQPFITEINDMTLMQIMCETARGNDCKKLIARELSPTLIKEMFRTKTKDVYVKQEKK